MRFRFIGRYTNGHTSINACGIVFEGREPSDVPEDAVERLSRNPEFEVIEDMPVITAKAEPVAMSVAHDPDDFSPVVQPKRRGRPRKAAN